MHQSEHIISTIWINESAQICLPADCPRRLGPAGLEVAALPRGAGGVGEDGAGGGVAARVVAVILQAAVALLPGLHEPVTAHRSVEQGARLVTETVVHACKIFH